MQTQSVESRIEQIMTRRDITAEFLGQLTAMSGYRGLPQPRISAALRGTKPFSNEQGVFLLDLVQNLEELCQLVHPIQPAFRNPAAVKSVLDGLQRGTLRIEVRHDVAAESAGYYVLFSGGFFVGRNRFGKPVSGDKESALLLTLDVAEQVLEELFQLRIEGMRHERANCGGDVRIITDFGEAWQPRNL